MGPEYARLFTEIRRLERQRDQLLEALKKAAGLLESRKSSGHGCSYTSRELWPELFAEIDAALAAVEGNHANNR